MSFVSETEASPQTPNTSPLAGSGPGGHKPSFRSTKLARRARSFKDDFLGKVRCLHFVCSDIKNIYLVYRQDFTDEESRIIRDLNHKGAEPQGPCQRISDRHEQVWRRKGTNSRTGNVEETSGNSLEAFAVNFGNGFDYEYLLYFSISGM